MAPSPISQVPHTRLPISSQKVSIPQPSPALRSGHLNLDTFSPVNQKGHFEFDRVLKSGVVYKRTRKTKVRAIRFTAPYTRSEKAYKPPPQQWKSHFLVLRPNLLSIYKSPSEERLLKQVTLSDLSAVAYLKDPKGKRQHVFGLFSPSRNFHLQTGSEVETKSWVELIKKEARIDEEEQGVIYGSPTQYEVDPHVFSNLPTQQEQLEQERYGSSSPEPFEPPPHSSSPLAGIRIRRPSIHDVEYSGNEMGSYSDFSEAAPSSHKLSPYHTIPAPSRSARPEPPRNASQHSISNPPPDEERVLWHGYLLCLKSRSGVRQWKRLWAVLRPKNLTFYKNEEEYAALLLIPLSNIINAVEIDPVSRSKAHCMQIIAEDRSYRFCAPSEEALARWLGALKSQLMRRREERTRKIATL